MTSRLPPVLPTAAAPMIAIMSQSVIEDLARWEHSAAFSTVGGNLHEHQAGALKYRSDVPFLPLLRQPTLILADDDDPMIPLANARLMHALIRGSRLRVYSGGHPGLVTQATELAPVVDGFLAAP